MERLVLITCYTPSAGWPVPRLRSVEVVVDKRKVWNNSLYYQLCVSLHTIHGVYIRGRGARVEDQSRENPHPRKGGPVRDPYRSVS